VKEYANRIGLPYSIDQCPETIGSGEVISFDPIHVMKLVLKATALFEEAKKRQIAIPQSHNGTQVSKKGAWFGMLRITRSQSSLAAPLSVGRKLFKSLLLVSKLSSVVVSKL
jgi:hypothetical protein